MWEELLGGDITGLLGEYCCLNRCMHLIVSREEARASFDASPFFGKWDKKVLDVYVECGLMINGSDGEEGVELKMPGIQEAQVFTESVTTYEAFERLDSLDPNIELRWIMPGRSPEQ